MTPETIFPNFGDTEILKNMQEIPTNFHKYYCWKSRNLETRDFWKSYLQDASAPAFSNFSQLVEFHYLDISTNNIFENELGLFLEVFGVLWCSQGQEIGLGSHGHVRYVRKSWKWWVLGFPKVKSKSYESKTKQNNSTELSGYSFLKICNKNGPPDPARHKIWIFLWLVLRSSLVNRHFFGLLQGVDLFHVSEFQGSECRKYVPKVELVIFCFNLNNLASRNRFPMENLGKTRKNLVWGSGGEAFLL